MIKRLLGCVREYKLPSILTFIFIVCEAVIETFIPFITVNLINGLEGDHLLIAPPLIISKSEIDKIIHILEKALQQFMDTRGMDENEPFRKRN